MTSPYNSGDPNFQQHDSIFGPPQQQPGGPGPMPQQPQPAMNAGMPQHVQQVVNVNLTAAQVQGMAGAEPVQHVKSFGVYIDVPGFWWVYWRTPLLHRQYWQRTTVHLHPRFVYVWLVR